MLREILLTKLGANWVLNRTELDRLDGSFSHLDPRQVMEPSEAQPPKWPRRWYHQLLMLSGDDTALSVLNAKDVVEKFNVKSDEGIFLGYSFMYKAFHVFNKRTLVIYEPIHVIFNELPKFKKNDFDDDFNFDALNLNKNSSPPSNLYAYSSKESLPKDWKYVNAHRKELIIGDTSKYV